MRSEKVVILHAVVSPYKVTLFNLLARQFPQLEVLYFSVTEQMRSWTVDMADLHHQHVVLNQGNLEDHSLFKISKQIWTELNRTRPDLVIVSEYIYPPYWIGLLWTILNRKKRIFFNESTAGDRPKVGWKESIKRFFVRWFDAGIAQSSKSRDYMVQLGMPADRVWVKGYSTDIQFYADGAKHARDHADEWRKKWDLLPFNIIFVGRFSPEKNLMTLLAAFEEISGEFSDWGLVLVGDGPDQAAIVQWSQDRQLRVRVIPFLQKNEVATIYGLGDIFVLPSTSEPWGLVVNEAMAAGLPVIVSDRAGCAHDLVRHGHNGFVFSPDQPAALVEWMRKLMGSTALRQELSHNGVASVSEFSSEKSADRMVAMMERCLDF